MKTDAKDIVNFRPPGDLAMGPDCKTAVASTATTSHRQDSHDISLPPGRGRGCASFSVVKHRGSSRSFAQIATAFAVLLIYGCGSGGGGGSAPPAVPDLSGVWAGAWQGTDPRLGFVTGTWQSEITQSDSSASGPGELLGDVDCMDGVLQTAAGNQSVPNGAFTRARCGTINWALTALDVDAGSAAGSWSNTATGGTGTLSGVRIARLGGPRIRFVHPPAGRPGTVVTVVGQALSDRAGQDELRFNETWQPTLQFAQASRIVARVPFGATTGTLQVSTSAGVARSPGLFSTDVISPPAIAGAAIIHGSAPAALAVSPDGRKIYVADRLNASVSVLRAASLTALTSTPIAGGLPRSVVAGPDGKRIYVAANGIGVLVMDAALATLLDTIPLALDDGGRDNPQGLAISPDGSLLLVSDGSPGGRVSVLRVADNTLVASMTFPAGIAPLGVAFSPDGEQAYVAAADVAGSVANTLRIFDPATGAIVDSIPVGALPTGIAVSPDARRVFVSNQGDNSVSLYDTATRSVSTSAVGRAPTGIAHGPDGAKVYVANRDSNTVSVLTGDSLLQTLATVPVGQAPIAIAINPQGTSAYVANVSSHSVSEVGGMRTLTVALSGGGIGSVSSTPSGIQCGTSCQAQFVAGSRVTLQAVAAGGSYFSGWSGDANCAGGVVDLNQNRNCIATFTSNSPPPSSGGGGSSGEGCFIATAAYGSALAPEVQMLRAFRDRRLMTNAPGRTFVHLYYRYSPALAEMIRPHDSVRAVVRTVLWPLIWSIGHPVFALSALLLVVLVPRSLRLGTTSRKRGACSNRETDPLVVIE